MSQDPGLAAAELQRRAARGATWSTISVTVSLPLAIAVSVILARSLGPEQFARFAYLTFLVPLLIVLLELGFAPAIIRAGSQAFARGDLAGTRDLLSKAFGWSLLRLPIVCAVVLVIARPEPAIAVVVVAALVLLTAGGAIVFSLQVENRGATSAKLAFLQGFASSVSSIVAASVSDSGTTVWAITLASGVAVLPVWLVVADPSLRRAALRPRLPRGLPEGFWRYGVTATVLALVSTLVFSRSEVVILEALGEQQALAVFALAFGLAQRLTTPVDTLLGPLIPALSAIASAHPERLRPGFGRALRLSSTAVAFLAGAAFIGTTLAAPVLFGPEYEGTAAVFAALAGVSLLRSAAQPYIAVAHAVGRLGGLVRANGIALIVDVALAVALIPTLGVWGAVIANAVGALLALVLSVRAIPQAGSVRDAGVPTRKLLAVTGGSVAAAYAAGAVGGTAGPAIGALAAYAVGACAFLTLARIFGGLLRESDSAVLLDVLPSRIARFSRPFIPVVTSGTATSGP